jgi:hypothetical protein
MNLFKKRIKFKKYRNKYEGKSCGTIAGFDICTLVRVVFALVIFIVVVTSCESKKEIDPNFIDTYKNILIMRERFVDDSLTAARKVDSVMKSHNYTEPKFREDYFLYAKEYNQQFINAIDSLRDMVREQHDSLKKIEEMLRKDSLK